MLIVLGTLLNLLLLSRDFFLHVNGTRLGYVIICERCFAWILLGDADVYDTIFFIYSQILEIENNAIFYFGVWDFYDYNHDF